MRISIIDLGTNTFNLLIAERDVTGRLHIVHSEERAVFLGRGGMERGLITGEAMERGLAVLGSFADRSHAMEVDRIHGYGTSALRNAHNAQDFTAQARSMFGIGISIIPGEEEAELILEGVRQAVCFTSKPMLVMDIGGGSIEFILATDKALMWKGSFEIGATRLLERFSPSDPLTVEEHFRIAAYLDARMGPLFAVMDRHWPTALIGSAGTFDTLAGMAAVEDGMPPPSEQNTMTFSSATFDAINERVVGSTRAERSRMKAIPEHRVDTLPLAFIAIERVLAQGIGELRWSRYALKEGAAWRAVR